MAKIAEILETGPTFSYEFFPPRDMDGARKLDFTIAQLALSNPDFISVTYRPDDTANKTRDIAITQNRLQDFPAMAHLTCAGQSKFEISKLVDYYAARGLGNILALRGDSTEPGDLKHAVDLVSFIKDSHPAISIGVAAHPEVHPDSPSRTDDRRHLAAKLEIADFAITQFFFNPDDYRRLVEELDELGCRKPVIPGIMLFASAAGLRRMAEMNNASLPEGLVGQLDTFDRPDDVGKLAVETAAELIDDLSADEVPGLHIYTLNRSRPALDLKRMIA